MMFVDGSRNLQELHRSGDEKKTGQGERPNDSQRLRSGASAIYRKAFLAESPSSGGSRVNKFTPSDLKADQSGVFFATTLITIIRTTQCPNSPILITFTVRHNN